MSLNLPLFILSAVQFGCRPTATICNSARYGNCNLHPSCEMRVSTIIDPSGNGEDLGRKAS